MRIGIDARFVTRLPRRGIGNYSLALIDAMVKLAPDIEFILYISNPDIEKILPTDINVSVKRIRGFGYAFWEQIALPYRVMIDKIDLLHCLGNTAPLRLFSCTKLVITLHDVMFLHSNEFVPIPKSFYQLFGRLYRSLIVPSSARKADAIITVSNYSKLDILQRIQSLDYKKLHVTYQSCSPLFLQKSLDSLSTDRPYFFALGATDPRKNTYRLVSSYLYLLKNFNIDENLIICGYINWKHSAAYKLVQESGFQNRVIFIDFVTLEDLVSLYQNAKIFLYPSLYEGFGIPILEAFSVGCPVIASNVSSIPEIAGDAALYVDPTSILDIAATIYYLNYNHSIQNEMRLKGSKIAKKFTWTESARRTIAIYKMCSFELQCEIS